MNCKAWITAEVFSNWLHKLGRHFLSNDRKVLMLVDNCSTHHNVPGIEATKLAFSPLNTMAAPQLMSDGISQFTKMKDRKHLLERMLLCNKAGKTYIRCCLSASCTS